ncbi:MAG: HDIG domain-containing protein [Victivallales bacterium]|nr:HDIG domain-containing protein [Victivallales bacterium]
MSESKSASSSSSEGGTGRDWLLSLVVFLLAWGFCISAFVLMLSFHSSDGRLPNWVGNDVKAIASRDTRSSFRADGDIFAEQSFSYVVEKKDKAERSTDAGGDSPESPDIGETENYWGDCLPNIYVCGRSKGNFSDKHQTGNLFHVEVDEPIVRTGEVLFETVSDNKRIFSPAFYKLLAYQEYFTQEEAVHWGTMRLICVAILSTLVLLFFGYSIYFLREDFYDTVHKQWLVLLLLFLHVGLLVLSNFIASLFENWPAFFAIIIFPAALVPSLMSNMLGRRTGICGAMCLSLLGPVIWGGAYQFQFFLHSLVCSLITIISFQNVHSRLRFLLGGIYLILSSFAMTVLFTWENNLAWAFNPPFGLFWLTMPMLLLLNALVVILGMLLLPPVCELVFNVTTVFTLNELNNRDHPILERLLKQAPGTYEHSLSVARLASDAARAIGANSRLTETCAYFHDIGKLCNPKMFAENLLNDEVNPHDEMTPIESANILRQHVRYGLELAAKAHLPHEVKEAIAQHHGTSIMAFFADQAMHQAEEAGEPKPNMAQFSYPGPLPRRIEVVLVSIADVCEAAVRASVRKWPSVTSALIREKVSSLVMWKFQSGQFDEAKMPISSLHKIIDAMVESLCVIYHVRPEYPESSTLLFKESNSQAKQEEQSK